MSDLLGDRGQGRKEFHEIRMQVYGRTVCRVIPALWPGGGGIIIPHQTAHIPSYCFVWVNDGICSGRQEEGMPLSDQER